VRKWNVRLGNLYASPSPSRDSQSAGTRVTLLPMSVHEILAEIPNLGSQDCARIKFAIEKRFQQQPPSLADLLDPILDDPSTDPIGLPTDLSSNPEHMKGYGK